MLLTKKDIERAKKRGKHQRLSDGRGLFLRVSPSGRRTWAFFYRLPDPSKDRIGPGGKVKRGYREREMTLGSPDFVGHPDCMDLDQARDRAVELRALLRQGVDPMEQRDRQTRTVIRQKRDGSTFKQVAERYMNEVKKAEWHDGGASEQSWRGSLAKHVYPAIGDMAVDRIDRADIRDLLLPLWTTRHVTASRLLPRLDLIFAFAIEEGIRSGNNPADRASFKRSLPKKAHRPKRHKSIPYAKVPDFMVELRARQAANPHSITPRALEFTILTAMRTTEVIGATWEEIDLEARIWTVPASRMKIKRTGSGEEREPHRVPLCESAVSLLLALPREADNPHIFIAPSEKKKGQALSNMAMLKFLKEDLGYKGEATVHGFRSSFKTWAAEATVYPDELSEIAIAHYPEDKTVSAYKRTDLLDKRVPLMDDWASFVAGGNSGNAS